MTERIHEAAILQHGRVYSAPRPLRHPHVGWLILLQGLQLDPGRRSGFTTTWGRFVERREAWKIAVREGQLLPDVRQVRGVLFSENVWAGGYKESSELLRQLKERFDGYR